jgi:dynein heavy chain
MSTPEFPFSIVQESTNVTSEQPRGLAFGVDLSVFDSKPSSQQFILSFALFAALIQDRKKFGPLEWNIIYEWSDSDFCVSTIMRRLLLHGTEVQWKVLLHLVGHIVFSGGVTDSWDRRTLFSHLERILVRSWLSWSSHLTNSAYSLSLMDDSQISSSCI